MPPFTEAEIRRQLERILAFSESQASDRRREMLRFVVEEALAGRSSQLKATSIAMAVFGRGADFDQQFDPVVRLEARKLRRDLDTFYAGVGREDPIRIEIPKGRYVPSFSRQRVHEQVEEPDTTRSAPMDTAPPLFDKDRPDRVSKDDFARLALTAAALFAFFGSVLFLLLQSDEGGPSYAGLPFRGASILVQTFETGNADTVSTLVAELLAQDITAALLKFPDIRAHDVLAAKDSEAERPIADPVRDQTLYTVRGIVWREESQLFVRAELSRNSDEEVLWSERYSESDRERGISGISDEISSQVASVIGQQYGIVRSETRERLLSDTSNPSVQSYACISRATEYRRTLREESYWATRNCLEETVRREPEFSRGWAMLAYLRNDGYRFGYEKELTKEVAQAQAREAAARALTLSPKDTDALKAMSHILHYAGDLEQSIEYARRALESNPNDPETVGNLGVMLGFQGRFSEARPLLEFAIERSMSPAPRYYQFLAMAHMMGEDWDGMLSAASYALADGSGMSYFLSAIANATLGKGSAAKMDYLRVVDRWPLLAEDPKAALEVHKVDPALVQAFVAGLDRVRAVAPR